MDATVGDSENADRLVIDLELGERNPWEALVQGNTFHATDYRGRRTSRVRFPNCANGGSWHLNSCGCVRTHIEFTSSDRADHAGAH